MCDFAGVFLQLFSQLFAIYIWISVLIPDNRKIKYSNVIVFLMLRAYYFWTCYVKILLGSSFYGGVGVSVRNLVSNLSLTAFGLLL